VGYALWLSVREEHAAGRGDADEQPDDERDPDRARGVGEEHLDGPDGVDREEPGLYFRGEQERTEERREQDGLDAAGRGGLDGGGERAGLLVLSVVFGRNV
jgi:hypothetical protein